MCLVRDWVFERESFRFVLLFHALISEAHPPLYGIQRLGILPLIGTLLVSRATAFHLDVWIVKFFVRMESWHLDLLLG